LVLNKKIGEVILISNLLPKPTYSYFHFSKEQYRNRIQQKVCL